MKGDQTTTARQETEDRREIAVADERLSRQARLFDVEQRQELRAAVPAANSDNSGDRRIAPRVPKRRGANLG
jgi:hypothetical protein